MNWSAFITLRWEGITYTRTFGKLQLERYWSAGRRKAASTILSYWVAVIDQLPLGMFSGRSVPSVLYSWSPRNYFSRQKYSRDLSQGGLEIPCKLPFTGPAKYVDKLKALIRSTPELIERFEEKVKDWSSDLKKKIVITSSETEEKCCPGDPVQSTIWLQTACNSKADQRLWSFCYMICFMIWFVSLWTLLISS